MILELGRDPGLAPVVQVPVEPEKLFGCLEHDLPGREQLQEIAGGIADEPGELPDGSGLESLLDAAAGLARHEAEGTFSQSIVRHGRLAPETIWELKTQMLKKSGLLQLRVATHLTAAGSSYTATTRPGSRAPALR